MTSLRDSIEQYISLRQALGFQLDKPARILREFASFMESQNANLITKELSLSFAKLPKQASPHLCATRFGIVRRFAIHRSATDSRTYVPTGNLLSSRYRRRKLYIYSESDVAKIVAESKELPSQTSLRGQTYSTLFGLLAVTGLRISEVISLDRKDVNIKQGIITIQKTKFRKSRLIVLHQSTQDELKRYVQFRNKVQTVKRTSSFFVAEDGARLTTGCIRGTFVKISRRIGIRTPLGRFGHGPRVHDLRHTFAVKTLIHWYKAGLNVEEHIFSLSTYLGHVHPSDTYWYLSASPELLGLAAARLENQKGALL
jgi:integrase/recombinase XerD